jgi:single-stranded-DNA-specific exonuclease
MTEKRWIYKPNPPQKQIDLLVEKLHVSTEMATLLAQRGIADFDEAKAFFRPDLTLLHDPFMLKVDVILTPIQVILIMMVQA